MNTERFKHMEETLLCAIEMQLCDLGEVDTKELGEVVDMVKDLEEAIYYCTVTEAMKGNDAEWEREMKKGDHHYENSDSRMYYGGKHYPMMYNEDKDDYDEENIKHHHENSDWEGRSYMSRKMYMEAQETKKDKATQLRELEKYMSELSQDIVDMIADTSLEERQYLEKKMTALASKIGQMK